MIRYDRLSKLLAAARRAGYRAGVEDAKAEGWMTCYGSNLNGRCDRCGRELTSSETCYARVEAPEAGAAEPAVFYDEHEARAWACRNVHGYPAHRVTAVRPGMPLPRLGSGLGYVIEARPGGPLLGYNGHPIEKGH